MHLQNILALQLLENIEAHITHKKNRLIYASVRSLICI